MSRVLAFVAAVAYLLFTPAGMSHLTHVWAEDGARFLLDAVQRPLWTNLAEPYGGYLHVIPRLGAELVSLLPLDWAPIGFAVLAALVRAGIALLTFAASAHHLRSLPVRIGLAAMVVLLPVGNSEPLGNLSNLHWFLLYGAFWAILWRTTTRAQTITAAVVVVISVLSSPLTFLLVPLAIYRLATGARAVPIAYLAAQALQAVAVTLAERVPYSNQAVDPVQVLLAALLRGPVAAFIGSEQVVDVYPHLGNLLILAALALAAVPIALGAWYGDRFLTITAATYAAVIIGVVLVANWTVGLQIQQPDIVMAAQRYSVAPGLFLLTAVAAGLDRLPEPRWARATVQAARVVIPTVLLAGVGLHLWTGERLDGIPWTDAVARARASCGEVARIDHEPDGWFFDLPCARL
ncbi:hypothetical protein [Actinokineospora sp. HUAS TT18]|uniref:hypothetical protein n=1 Tax=Actinokineospora sp. HUAS TT18 TaxID=3447451 RepID=UPI003F5250D9